jgi:hypothetical protein
MTEKIVVRSAFTTRYQPTVRYAAIKVAWQLGLTFSVQGLASVIHKPVTSALRRVLTQMVAEGELFSFLGQNQRGRLTRYYCAQRSKQIEWKMENIA